MNLETNVDAPEVSQEPQIPAEVLLQCYKKLNEYLEKKFPNLPKEARSEAANSLMIKFHESKRVQEADYPYIRAVAINFVKRLFRKSKRRNSLFIPISELWRSRQHSGSPDRYRQDDGFNDDWDQLCVARDSIALENEHDCLSEKKRRLIQVLEASKQWPPKRRRLFKNYLKFLLAGGGTTKEFCDLHHLNEGQVYMTLTRVRQDIRKILKTDDLHVS